MTLTPPGTASALGGDVFRLIFDYTHRSLALDLDGTVLEVNRSVLEVGSLSRERIIGRPSGATACGRRPSASGTRPGETSILGL